MNRNLYSSPQKQRGIAALFVAVMLLIAVTLLVMFASRVALLDQRTSANEYRHGQAFAQAEAGLEQAAAFLRANPFLHQPDPEDDWATCEAGDGFPCGDGVTMVFGTITDGVVESGIVPLEDLPRATSFLVRTDAETIRGIGVGESDDGTGASIVEVGFGIANILSPGQIPPLMTPVADLSGNFTVVPNPNGGGPGVPISVWSKNPTTGPGVASWQTCDHGDFRDNSGNICIDTKSGGIDPVTGAPVRDWGACSCSDTRSVPTDIRADVVVEDDENFPDSPFTYVFGDATDDVDDLKAQIKMIAEMSGLVLPNCSNLAANFNSLVGSALVWIEGDCDMPTSTVIGNRDKPIILVVEGDVSINANTEVWGLIFGFGDSMRLNGGPVIHGSIVAEVATDLTNGSYTQVYDETVFQNLLDDSINTELTKLSYSWRDFQPE
jgi:hypothetical protein